MDYIEPTTQEGISDDIDAAVQPNLDILDSEMPTIPNKPKPAKQNFSLPQVQKPSTGSQAASVLGGGLSGAELGSSFGPVGTAIGFVVGAVGTWWGTESQKQAADKANSANEGEEQHLQNLKNIQQNKEDTATQKAQNEKDSEISWKENDAEFQRAQSGVNRMLELFNANNGFKQAFEQGNANMMNVKKNQMYDFKGLNPIGRN
jgi:hypothetical protein